MDMNTSKELLHSIELSNLINKIELQVNNIEIGDAHTEIGNLMAFPFKSIVDYSDLRKEAMKELYGMLYKAFCLICQISLETNNENMLSVASKSCSNITDILLSTQLRLQKLPMSKPSADLYNEAIVNLQQNNNESLISRIKNLANVLFQ